MTASASLFVLSTALSVVAPQGSVPPQQPPGTVTTVSRPPAAPAAKPIEPPILPRDARMLVAQSGGQLIRQLQELRAASKELSHAQNVVHNLFSKGQIDDMNQYVKDWNTAHPEEPFQWSAKQLDAAYNRRLIPALPRELERAPLPVQMMQRMREMDQ